MRPYELMFILDTGLPEDERRDIANEVEKELIDLGAEVNDSEQFDVRDLEYEIDDVSRGEYRLIRYESNPSENINNEIRERLNFRDDIVRYIIINREEYQKINQSPFEEESEEPAAAEQSARTRSDSKKSTTASDEDEEDELETEDDEVGAEA